MNKNDFNIAYTEIERFRDKLGETFYDAVQEGDNTTYEMAKGIISVFNEKCSTKEEFAAADAMLTAVCGYNIEELIGRINERNRVGYQWNFF